MVKLSEKAMAKKAAYNQEYAKKNFRNKNIQFNTQIPEDIALLDWIKSQENGTQYDSASEAAEWCWDTGSRSYYYCLRQSLQHDSAWRY